MESTKLIAIYGRVSSSNQENEGTIETQLRAIRDYADAHHFIIVKEYTDNGWSGDNLNRPALDQLRVDAKKKLWDGVLLYDPDRLARRYSYQELVMDELREGGIEVFFVTTPTPKNGVEKILYGVQGLFAEYERAKIAERFRLGKVRKAKEGHIITTEAPYGYTFILKKGKPGDSDFRQGYYEINDVELATVRKIFAWVDEGMTLRGVIRKLKELQILPRKSKRGVWSTSTLYHLLRNKTYIGEGHFGASYATIPERPYKKTEYRKIRKTSRRMRPENEWIKISTPKVLNEDLFYRVGERLKNNLATSKRNTKNEYLLAGKIWCQCGKRRTGEGILHGKHLYYRCTDRGHSFPLPPNCTEKGINARIADGLVWEKIESLMSSSELLAEQAHRWIKVRHNQLNGSIPEMNNLQKEVLKLKEQEDRYAKAYGAGIFSIDQFKDLVTSLRSDLDAKQRQLSSLKQEANTTERLLPTEGEIELFTRAALKTLKSLNFQTKKAIVNAVVEKVIATSEKLLVSGYVPIKSDVVFCSNNRNSWNIITHSESQQLSIPFEFKVFLPPPIKFAISRKYKKAA